jgi:hypothetical protein
VNVVGGAGAVVFIYWSHQTPVQQISRINTTAPAPPTTFTLLLLKMEPIEGSETSAYIYQTPGNYPKENIIYSEHGESLKSSISDIFNGYRIYCPFKKDFAPWS